jgi:hypothetical protein
MNEKGKVVVELSDEMWLLYLLLLCDINYHLNDLNTKFQGQKKLLSDILGLSELLK